MGNSNQTTKGKQCDKLTQHWHSSELPQQYTSTPSPPGWCPAATTSSLHRLGKAIDRLHGLTLSMSTLRTGQMRQSKCIGTTIQGTSSRMRKSLPAAHTGRGPTLPTLGKQRPSTAPPAPSPLEATMFMFPSLRITTRLLSLKRAHRPQITGRLDGLSQFNSTLSIIQILSSDCGGTTIRVCFATITRLGQTNPSTSGHTLRTHGAPLTMLANSSSWTVTECSSQRLVTTKDTSPSQKRMGVEV